MMNATRLILSIGLSVVVCVCSTPRAQAQLGGLQIQIGGPYGGSGLYVGGFNVPFGVGPSIPPTSRAYMGPQYQSGYRGYYGGFGVPPSLGIYSSPLDYPTYRSYGYADRGMMDVLQRQQYALQRQQLELQAAQRSLSMPQMSPYSYQPRYSTPSPRASAPGSDLRPGMVLPDGSTVISVGPLSPVSEPTVQPNAAVNGSGEPKKAAF